MRPLYLSFKLNYRDLVAMMSERGVGLAHTTILRWVQHKTQEFEKRWRRFARTVGGTDRDIRPSSPNTVEFAPEPPAVFQFSHDGSFVAAAGDGECGGGEASAGTLTPTERRILHEIAAGKSSQEIGAELSIHYRTVKNHRTNICRRLGLESANAPVRFALQNKPHF